MGNAISREACKTASECLTLRAEEIIELWELRAKDEVKATMNHESLLIRDHLLDYVHFLAESLSTKIVRTPIRLENDRLRGSELGKLHGNQRAGMLNYSIDQTILEFHILRRVVFEALEEEEVLSVKDRDIIFDSIERLTMESAAQFSKALDDVHAMFMANLIHDMRGPVNTALGSAQLILKLTEAKGGENNQFLQAIIDNMKLLASRLQSLLDSSKLKAGESLDLNLEPCSLRAITEGVLNDLRIIDDTEIHFSCHGADDGLWNKDEIRRCVENLLSNACKHRSENTAVTVKIEGKEKWVVFSTQNFCPAIPKEDYTLLFKQFRQTSKAQGKGGWGIGLFLVKEIVERHHGKVYVTSDEVHGTTFTIELPKVPPHS